MIKVLGKPMGYDVKNSELKENKKGDLEI